MILNKLVSLMKRIELADIHQTQVLGGIAHESILMAVLQIEVDDAETLRHLGQQGYTRG